MAKRKTGMGSRGNGNGPGLISRLGLGADSFRRDRGARLKFLERKSPDKAHTAA